MIRLLGSIGRAHVMRPLLLLMLLLSVTGVYSQESLRLSPGDAVELAVRNNLSLENARIDLDTRQRRADYAWNQFLPSVSVSGTMSRANQATTQPGITIPAGVFGPTPVVLSQSYTLPQWSLVGSLSASLNFSFAMIAGMQATKANYQAGLVGYERARLQMERDIRKTYNSLLLLESNVELLRESYINAERQAAMAEANYNAGLVPRLTWLQAQVQVENMKPTIAELENSLKALSANFAMTLGLPYDTVFELEPLLDGSFEIPLDVAELISRAASGKPDILELQRNIITLEATRKATAIQLYTPFLNLNWGITQAFNGDPLKDSWFNSDNWRDRGSFSVTLGISLNGLLPFTSQGQGLRDQNNQLSSLSINLAQLIRGTELEIFTKVNSLEKTQTQAEVQMAAVELAELSYRLTEEAYRAGLQDFQSVQNSALALNQAKSQLLVQQFNYLNDLLDLEYAVGVPFGTLSSRY